MPNFTTTFRKTTVQFLREHIGDEDNLIYPTDDDLDIFLRNRITWGVWNERLTAFKNHYYSADPGPVIDLEITSGATAGNTYRVDECTKHIAWSGSGSGPADNHTIEVSYMNIYFFGVVRDVLLNIATDKAKLAIKAKAEGMSHDLTQVRSEIMKQIQAIAAVEYWGP